MTEKEKSFKYDLDRCKNQEDLEDAMDKHGYTIIQAHRDDKNGEIETFWLPIEESIEIIKTKIEGE